MHKVRATQHSLTPNTLISSCGGGIRSPVPLELNQELHALARTATADCSPCSVASYFVLTIYSWYNVHASTWYVYTELGWQYSLLAIEETYITFIVVVVPTATVVLVMLI